MGSNDFALQAEGNAAVAATLGEACPRELSAARAYIYWRSFAGHTIPPSAGMQSTPIGAQLPRYRFVRELRAPHAQVYYAVRVNDADRV
jgi:hypothetical protein